MEEIMQRVWKAQFKCSIGSIYVVLLGCLCISKVRSDLTRIFRSNTNIFVHALICNDIKLSVHEAHHKLTHYITAFVYGPVKWRIYLMVWIMAGLSFYCIYSTINIRVTFRKTHIVKIFFSPITQCLFPIHIKTLCEKFSVRACLGPGVDVLSAFIWLAFSLTRP